VTPQCQNFWAGIRQTTLHGNFPVIAEEMNAYSGDPLVGITTMEKNPCSYQ
jgi:hypothetical protein